MDTIYFAELLSSTATEEVYVPIGQIKLYIAIKNTIGSAPVNLTVHECNGNNLERDRVTENSVRSNWQGTSNRFVQGYQLGKRGSSFASVTRRKSTVCQTWGMREERNKLHQFYGPDT